MSSKSPKIKIDVFQPLEKLRKKYEAYKKDNNLLAVNKKYSSRFRSLTEADLINAESELGRTLFGPVPLGHQREFFQDKKNSWIWYDSWTELGTKKEITIHYEVKPDGVYKKFQGTSSQKITGKELENFRKALNVYLQICKEKLYF